MSELDALKKSHQACCSLCIATVSMRRGSADGRAPWHLWFTPHQVLRSKHEQAETKLAEFRNKLKETRQELSSKDRQLEVAKRMLQRISNEKSKAEVSGMTSTWQACSSHMCIACHARWHTMHAVNWVRQAASEQGKAQVKKLEAKLTYSSSDIPPETSAKVSRLQTKVRGHEQPALGNKGGRVVLAIVQSHCASCWLHRPSSLPWFVCAVSCSLPSRRSRCSRWRREQCWLRRPACS